MNFPNSTIKLCHCSFSMTYEIKIKTKVDQPTQRRSLEGEDPKYHPDPPSFSSNFGHFNNIFQKFGKSIFILSNFGPGHSLIHPSP